MPFVRRKRGQVLVVHNRRVGGGSEQVVLHAFASPAELRRVLQRVAWTTWQEDMAWRHAQYAWRWTELRGRLEAELAEWEREDQPGGALHRRAEVIRRLAVELGESLAPIAPASPADAVMLEQVRTPLEELRAQLERVLRRRSGAAAQAATEEGDVSLDAEWAEVDFDELDRGPDDPDRIFAEGMELWWAGDQSGACRLYRQALKRDPHHADAHNHLGIDLYERQRWSEAERHFRAAVEGGLRFVVRDRKRIAWGQVENRPYLRGLGNLALVLSRQGRWAEAVELWERILRLNPNDNQGVRFLVGQGYQRLGKHEEAIRAFERALEDPVCCFDLALTFHATGQAHRIGMPLLLGFAHNRYFAPMLLGERWRRLKGFHGSSLAEPEWARDYVDHQGDLWRSTPGSADMLRHWWTAGPVRDWRAQLDEVIVRLGELEVGSERSALVTRGSQLADSFTRADLARAVDPAAIVKPTARTSRTGKGSSAVRRARARKTSSE